MRHAAPPRNDQAGQNGWGYAFAGLLALAFAAAIQFAFGELTPEAADDLPYFGPVYKVAGKLGLTVPLAALGFGLVLLDVFRHLRRPKAVPAGRGEGQEGQPEAQGTDGPPSGAKIPALPGRAKAGTPGAAKPPGNGQVRLASAKYMGWKGKSGG
jgi:hypothetical protein